MNIALIGYGKMGKIIEKMAVERGHSIAMRITSKNLEEFTIDNLKNKNVEVAIEFTNPHSAVKNITICLEAGIKVVSGSTGWLEGWDKVISKMEAENGAFLYASNFSVGMNIFFALNKHLAKMMDTQVNYDIEMREIHHTAKVDAPSGTAVTLANDMIQNLKRKNAWILGTRSESDVISIEAVREDPAPGTHEIKYTSEIDDIEIIHTAKSRKGFALGAILAAEYLSDKKGLHTMNNVLEL